MPPDSDSTDLSHPLIAEAIATGAVAGAAAESAGHHGPRHTHCENCGTALQGPYCHRCGQHDFEFHRSFRHVFLEALESFFHFEGKFFRNIVTLLFSPGRLTAEFNAGKRAAQMPPFQLYLFVSVLFFFLIFLGKTPEGGLELDGPNQAGPALTKEEARTALNDALTGARENLAGNPAGSRLVDQVQAAADKAVARKKAAGGKFTRNSELARWAEEQGRRATDPVHQRELVGIFIHSIPKMLLVCLPFFALFTRVLFRKSGHVYLQHLVLALHFHTFIYLCWLCRDGWARLADLAGDGLGGWIRFACTLWLLLYPLLMLRRLFADSWLKTVVKTGLLGVAHACTLGVAFVVTAVIIFMLL